MESQSSSEKKNTTELEELVKQLVQKELEKTIPHECFTCEWFQFSKTPPRNRYCQYPGPIELERGVCKMWKLETDPQMRSRGFC